MFLCVLYILKINMYWGQWKINLIHFGLIISCRPSAKKGTLMSKSYFQLWVFLSLLDCPRFFSQLWFELFSIYLLFFPGKLIPSVESTTANPTWFNIPLMKILLSPDGTLSMSVLLQTWHRLLLGCMFLSILRKDFMLFESRDYAMLLWGLHFLYLPTMWSRCFLYLTDLLRPNKFEPKMKPDSSWDSLWHLCISCEQRYRLPFLRTIFQVCVYNSLGR